MSGINRLGNAPPLPGTLRLPDPNRFRNEDMYAEGTEGDIEYARMVKDIEDMQQRQGWLAGRGAFDKGELLYLRDVAEQQRHLEMEQRDTESAEFAAMRARIEREAELEARLPLGRQGTLQKQGSGDRDKPRLKPCLKVKPTKKGSKAAGASSSDGSASKRQKLAQGAAPDADVPGPSPAAAATAAAGPGPSSASAAAAAAAGAGAKAQPRHDQDQASSGDEGCGGLLGGLLGDYGSDSESEGAQNAAAATAAAAEGGGKTPGGTAGAEQGALPSALEVLEGEVPDTLVKESTAVEPKQELLPVLEVKPIRQPGEPAGPGGAPRKGWL